MSDENDRTPASEAEARAELASLAGEGGRRALAAQATRQAANHDEDEASRDTCLRLAVGMHYGSPVRWVALGFLIGGVAIPFLPSITHGAVPGSTALTLAGFFVAVLAAIAVGSPQTASRRRIAAERAWVTSLPFRMDGYFEILREEPRAGCRLVVNLSCVNSPTGDSADVVRMLMERLDIRAEVAPYDASSIEVRSGPISCNSWRNQRGSRPQFYNYRLVAYAHKLVSEVLLPLQRSNAISSVQLRREHLTSRAEVDEALGLRPER